MRTDPDLSPGRKHENPQQDGLQQDAGDGAFYIAVSTACTDQLTFLLSLPQVKVGRNPA